jgi:hypothetical protein
MSKRHQNQRRHLQPSQQASHESHSSVDQSLGNQGLLERLGLSRPAVEPVGESPAPERGGDHQREALNARQDPGAQQEANPIVAAGEEYIGIKRYGFDEARKLTANGGEDRGKMAELWCSGLLTASLLDVGVDVDAPIEDEYYYPGEGRKRATVRSVAEGYREGLAESPEAGAALAGRGNDAYYGQNSMFGDAADGSQDNLRVKGAAGAMVLAGIGREVSVADTRPGDMCQRRRVNSGDGHAWMVHEVVVLGDATFGLPGSPELLDGDTPQTPEVLRGVRFRISKETQPNAVISGVVESWRVLESNSDRGWRNDDAMDLPNGGVGVRSETAVEVSERDRLYIGRLTSSLWTVGE